MPGPELTPAVYDRFFLPGFHLFLTRGIEAILSNFDPKEVRWRAIIGERVDFDWFAKRKGAEEIDAVLDRFPNRGTRLVRWHKLNVGDVRREDSPAAEEPDSYNIAQEKVYRFAGPVYVGTVVFMKCEYGNMTPVMCNFVAAASRSKVEEFRDSYLRAERERNRRVLNYAGVPVTSFRPMDWGNISLEDGMAEQIQGSCDGFFKSKELYARHNVDWRFGMLFMGPPGNGKTAVCRAIATTTKVPVIYCSLADAEANVILSHLPWTICNNAPCILMMEDVDAMAENDSMRAGFLNILDGLAGEAGVLTIASTNCPDKLDPAFSARPSRFDELYVFENPTEQARREILSNKLGKRVGPKQIAQLAKKTNGLSAAFVQEVAVKTLRDSFLGDKPIAEKELAESLRKVRKHFSDSAKDWVGRIGFS